MTSSRYSGPSCHDLDNTLRIDAGSCRGGFDFSLLFEETILEILPILLILILIPVRLWQLSQKRNKVVGSWLVLVKLVSWLCCENLLSAVRMQPREPRGLWNWWPIQSGELLSNNHLWTGSLVGPTRSPNCTNSPMGPSGSRQHQGLGASQCDLDNRRTRSRSAFLCRAHALCATLLHFEHLSLLQFAFRYCTV